MKNLQSSIAAVIGLIISAQASAASQPVKMDPNNETLNYFEGAWRCVPDATSKLEQNGAELAVLDFHRALNYWLVGKVIVFGSEPTEAATTIAYDAHEKKFIDIGICDKGGYGYAYAPGWENDSLTFTGFKHAQDGSDSHFQKVLKKIDDSSFSMTYSESSDGTNFQVKKEATCSR